MQYLRSYFLSAKEIIEQYHGEIPLSAFLKNHFSKEKKYGSRDRKMIAAWCYNYFRLGHSLKDKTIEQKLYCTLFLFTTTPNDFLEEHNKTWNEKIALPIAEKAQIASVEVNDIFPFKEELSDEIDTGWFNNSYLIQPDLFIRIRPGKAEIARERLQLANVSYNEVNSHCLSFPNGTKLESVLKINEEVVIQDASSQRIMEMFEPIHLPRNAALWDCCAASGGKAIMANDYLGPHSLLVSDIRPSIMHNLEKRLSESGLKNYQSFVGDMTHSAALKKELGNRNFDLIICDVPCSGSGTWGRTPEQLKFFDKIDIIKYSKLQKQIVQNAIPFLKNNGYFLYITCSVFKQENELLADAIKSYGNFNLIKSMCIKGYQMKADTMYSALFQLK